MKLKEAAQNGSNESKGKTKLTRKTIGNEDKPGIKKIKLFTTFNHLNRVVFSKQKIIKQSLNVAMAKNRTKQEIIKNLKP